MPKTILLPRQPMPVFSFCVCVMRGMGGSVFFSYYDETAEKALKAARKWSGAQLLYVVRVKPKREN
jgi:hypothetical protein